MHDPGRIDDLHSHRTAAAAAMAEGVDLRGCFAWSLMDDFEWAHGDAQRFGLVHVDDATQQCTPKDSARACTDVIRRHRAAHA